MLEEEDGFVVQFAYVPELDITGRVTEQGPYYCFIEYEEDGIVHEEMFNNDEVFFTKQIIIPIEREWEEE